MEKMKNSRRLTEFYELCHDLEFWREDLFMEAIEIAPKFDKEDWKSLKKDWGDFDEQWKNNIIISLTDSYDLAEKIDFAAKIFEAGELEYSFQIFNQVRSMIFEQEARELYLHLSEKLWLNLPDKRKWLKVAIQVSGNGKKFLQYLGVEKWKDLGI